MVRRDRLTDWDAHPRRSRRALVDDRILTSCAAACARMDDWWTPAAGTMFFWEKGLRIAIDRLDAEDRSHGSITWSARSSSDGGMVRPRAFAVFRLRISSTLVRLRVATSPLREKLQ